MRKSASIFVKGVGAISLEFLFSPAKEFGRSGGIFYQLMGSLLMVLTATFLAVPLAVGTALFLYSYKSKKRTNSDIVHFSSDGDDPKNLS